MSYIVIESPIKDGWKSPSMTGSVYFKSYFIERNAKKNTWEKIILKYHDQSKSRRGKKIVVGKFQNVQNVVSLLQEKKISIWFPFGLQPPFAEIIYLHYPDELEAEVKAAKQFFYKIEEIT